MDTPDSRAQSARAPRRLNPRNLPTSCRFCRARKIKCDTRRPTCGSCVIHGRDCAYDGEQRVCQETSGGGIRHRRGPGRSTSSPDRLRRQNQELEDLVSRLKQADSNERNALLDSMVAHPGDIGNTRATEDEAMSEHARPATPANDQLTESLLQDSALQESAIQLADAESPADVTSFISKDESGEIRIFGPSSLRHVAPLDADREPSDQTPVAQTPVAQPPLNHVLIANAALERQKEYALRKLQTIRGLPADLVLHLLDLHWNRTHHTFLLTYRPAFMRELVDGGQYCSEFLFNAVLACSCKYSERLEVRDDVSDPSSTGRRFFTQCDILLADPSMLTQSRISTVTGLLMLGSTFNAKGLTSKAWLYTGYALRMVYDLGLHLECKGITDNPEEVEIRRRVFWGAFICDKLQSLSLGRPFTIQLRDSHVSRDFMDAFEEMELWTPYIDPQNPYYSPSTAQVATPTYNVSTFQNFCTLARIMTRIITSIYVVGATSDTAKPHLVQLDRALEDWYKSLPTHLVFEPWAQSDTPQDTFWPPHVVLLLTMFHATVILLHRPFIFKGHLGTTKVLRESWKRCTSAARSITSLILAYQAMHPLRRAQYLFSYCVYVACTIYVQNILTKAAESESHTSSLNVCLRALDELAIPNSGSSYPAKIIRKLMHDHGIPDSSGNIAPLMHEQAHGMYLDVPGMSPESWDMGDPMSFFDFAPNNHDLVFGFMDNALAPSNAPGEDSGTVNAAW